VRVSHHAMHLDGPLGKVGHQSADGAAVRPGSEGGRRPRRVSRHITLHRGRKPDPKVLHGLIVGNADRFGTNNRTQPWEVLLMPLFGRFSMPT
jgi:hypothetical protein